MKPIDNPCPRLVDRCAKIWRIDLIQRKYNCLAYFDDELEEFWTTFSEETGVNYNDLTEQGAIRIYERFRIEGTSIIAWQA